VDPRYPPIEPYDSGFLDSGDGHRVYWECCGNPDGEPALYLHGGPGSGFSPGQRRFFDPDRWRIVLFDQRGSGNSRPLASAPEHELSTNTTAHLIRDMEALRRLHGIERWALLGLSWGTTLGLAYAQRHPDRVGGLVLALVTTTSRSEVQWITEEVGCLFPEAWHRFSGAVPAHLRNLRLVDAYARLLSDGDPDVCERAALEWCRWEEAHISLTPGQAANPRFEDPEFRLRFARLVTHYWRHAAFLGEDQLLRDAHVLNGIPGILIHGRYDVSSPLRTAWLLSRRWTSSRLRVLDDAGHGGGDTFLQAVVDALNEIPGR
jgi:proline iminopeptidase